jgi:hypothetical protein
MVIENKPQKDVFWKALIFTAVIFLLGVFMGYVLEEKRLNDVQEEFEQLIIDWGDVRTQAAYYQTLGDDPAVCERAVDENLNFGDRIYYSGLRLEEYEEANRLTDRLQFEKQKHNMLRTEFYINSLVLREKCDAQYDVVVYFYMDNAGDFDLDLNARQNVLSVVLEDLKEQKGPELVLIPLAANMDISVVNILLDTYGVEEFPSLLLLSDSGYEVVSGVQGVGDIEPLLSPF